MQGDNTIRSRLCLSCHYRISLKLSPFHKYSFHAYRPHAVCPSELSSCPIFLIRADCSASMSHSRPLQGNVAPIDVKLFLVALATVVSFGVIHLFAWNLQFPTLVEGLLWKISAIITIACPTLYVGSHLPLMGETPKNVTTKTATK